jgi:hypothetical protein
VRSTLTQPCATTTGPRRHSLRTDVLTHTTLPVPPAKAPAGAALVDGKVLRMLDVETFGHRKLPRQGHRHQLAPLVGLLPGRRLGQYLRVRLGRLLFFSRTSGSVMGNLRRRDHLR